MIEEERTDVVDVDLEEEKVELSDDKMSKSCWVPKLKTLGNILVVHIQRVVSVESNEYFQRKKFCRQWC